MGAKVQLQWFWIGALAIMALGVACSFGTPNEAGSASKHGSPPPHLIGFMGDSWACGGGLALSVGPDGSYAAQTAKLLGSKYRISCAGGSGYVAPGDTVPFGDRVDDLLAGKPDVVIVQGSTNDYIASESEIESAAEDLFARIRRALPNTRVFALGPAYTPDAPRALTDVARAAIQAAADESGVTWIDLASTGWLDPAVDYADGYHPNANGHRVLARHLADALSTD